tara:strand:+ start:258 stop:620 length:363 start_codon:yes stop_codon:yes gene_type:complete
MTKFTYGSRRARKLAGLTTKKPKPAKAKVSQVLKSMSNAQLRNRIIKGILKRPARKRTKARRKKTAPRVKWADRVMQGKIPIEEIQFNEIIPHLKIAADPVLPPEPKLDTPRIEAMFEEI